MIPGKQPKPPNIATQHTPQREDAFSKRDSKRKYLINPKVDQIRGEVKVAQLCPTLCDPSL